MRARGICEKRACVDRCCRECRMLVCRYKRLGLPRRGESRADTAKGARQRGRCGAATSAPPRWTVAADHAALRTAAGLGSWSCSVCELRGQFLSCACVSDAPSTRRGSGSRRRLSRTNSSQLLSPSPASPSSSAGFPSVLLWRLSVLYHQV